MRYIFISFLVLTLFGGVIGEKITTGSHHVRSYLAEKISHSLGNDMEDFSKDFDVEKSKPPIDKSKESTPPIREPDANNPGVYVPPEFPFKPPIGDSYSSNNPEPPSTPEPTPPPEKIDIELLIPDHPEVPWGDLEESIGKIQW